MGILWRFGWTVFKGFAAPGELRLASPDFSHWKQRHVFKGFAAPGELRQSGDEKRARKLLSIKGFAAPVELRPFTEGVYNDPRVSIKGFAAPGELRPAQLLVVDGAGVPCFVKQLGAHCIDAPNGVGGHQARAPEDLGIKIRNLKDRKGGDPKEWPDDLRVREWPRV